MITPNGGKLQVEALVANLDIGFVKLGQEAVIKVDAFPFTRFGVLHGKVVKIASAAIAEQDAKRALANATAAANAAQAPQTAPGQPESFVFPVTVALDETAMKIDNAVIPLDPRHDGHRRNQDRLPPRDRLPAVARSPRSHPRRRESDKTRRSSPKRSLRTRSLRRAGRRWLRC